jgi:hypothetical protein
MEANMANADGLPDLDPTQPVDCTDWENIAAADLLAASMGLPVPWLDPDYPHEDRVNFALSLAEQLGPMHAKALLMLDPNAERGEAVRAAAVKAGRQRRGQRKGPPDDQLCDEVAALQAPKRSWTWACDKVAGRHGLSGRSVRERTRPAKW